jgi:parallel beta-helix repeat protein
MTVPSQVLDLRNWKITLPTGSKGHPTELSGAALAAASIPDTFWADNGAVHFRAPVNGVTTSGSGFPRSELRELNPDGSLASWSSTDGKTHTLVVNEAFVHMPNVRTSGTAGVVGAQIHDADNDISVFRCEGSKLYVTNGDDTHYALADDAYVPGTRFEAKFVVADGKVQAFYNGALVTTIAVKFSGGYFKAGCYTQANASNSKPADSSNYGETVVYSVTVAHGAPVPVPTPTPAPSGTQTLGVGGVATPAGAIVATADSTAPVTFTKAGVYDGQGHKVGRVTVKGDNITVQNYRVYGNGQYGIVTEGSNNTIQNNDIKGIKVSGDGDLNAITWFGNGTRILFNTAENYVEGDPGDSHTDACQTWVSSSHPVASSDVEIRGNRFVGPANPGRDPKVPSIHQCIMAEDYGRGGNSGGSSSGMKNWLIADNYFGDSWNQCIKLDGVDGVTITRNAFAGSSDKIVDLPQGSVKFYADNKVTGSYGSVGVPITPGPGPGAPVPFPVPTPTPVPDPVPTPVPTADVVMIIRHGEKPPSKADHTLNAAGYERARRLVGFFTDPKPGISTPTQIWASKGKTASMRPLQTVQPLAAALGLNIDTVYDFENAESTVGKALTKLHGVTLACSEHTAIPGICKRFKLAKGSPKPPKGWPSSRFDLVWSFTRQPDNTWLFAQIPEALMPGDQGYAISKVAGLFARAKQSLGIGN